MNSAVQLYNGHLTLITKPLPKLSNQNDVIVKVSYTGVNTVDIAIIDGHFPTPKRLIQGHEIAGFISEVGKNVKHLKIGDRVCVNPYDYCSICCYCSRGQPQFCISDGMKTALGFVKDGGWQMYCTVPGKLCFLLPTAMPIRKSVFCQPLSNILHGWDNMGKINQDSKILLAGAGLDGLLWASLFHFYGYRDVNITEVFENQKEVIAKLNFGFSILNPGSIAKECENNSGDDTWGYDIIVDCTGNKKAIEKQFKWLRKGATFVLFGSCKKGNEISIEPFQLQQKEIKLVSSYLNRYCYMRTVELVHMMSNRYLDFKNLNIGVFNLQDYESAINSVRKGLVTKAVFEL